MEDRGFKEINVLQCSYQSQTDRYPTKGGVKAPTLALYRNNLTALSQCRNLLFVAYIDKVYVYRPQFPTQIVSSPELILDIPKSRRGLRGHIDPNKPHAVNQLSIGDLGNEEIFVAVCDDGDVVVYSTRSIFNAIHRDIPQVGANLKPTVEIKTLLLKNVGMSAWGIAIHKAARLIAVSSNLHQISVFAFALSRDMSPNSPSDLEDDEFSATGFSSPDDDSWVRVDESSYSPRHRFAKNVELILKGHEENIPNIAFCNTKADPIGQYLASTDITGTTFIWDVWQRRTITDLSSFYRISKPVCGWGVACLEQRSYRLANSAQETFGCDSIGSFGEPDDAVYTPCVTYDNTASSHSVPNSSQWHPSFSKYRIAPEGALQTSELSDGSTHTDDEIMGENNEDIGVEEDEYWDDDEDVEVGENEDHETLEMEPETILSFSGPVHSTLPAKHNAFNPSALSQRRRIERPTKISTLPFDIFTTTDLDLRFLFNVQIQEDSTCPISYHSVICKKALHQEIPPMLRYIGQYERLNMIIQIPELSVIIVANQLGRVALLTMTKSTKIPDQRGFRVDWILPFRTQEDMNHRPELPLIGMAAGPVQGREMMSGASTGVGFDSPEIFCDDAHHQRQKSSSARRYRLFLFYQDNSILSYEFWRSTYEHRYDGVREESELLF